MAKVEQNLQEIIDLVANAITTAKERFADGFQYPDLFAFIPVFMQIEPAVKDAKHALNYLKDMTKEKREDVINAVVEKLGDHPGIRDGATYILDFAASGYMLGKWISTQTKSDTPPTV